MAKTIQFFAGELIRIFPEYQQEYEYNFKHFDQILGHVFFSVMSYSLMSLLHSNKEKDEIKKYIDFIEQMFEQGNEHTKSIVESTILEHLGKDETVLKNAFTYFSKDLMYASKETEEYLRRRNITIFLRNNELHYIIYDKGVFDYKFA